MDIIERHVARLPPLDERWSVRPHDRGDLEAALLAGGVAGTATHPLDNVRANALMLIDGDPDKLFGLTGLQGSFDLDGILELVAREAGAPIDPEARPEILTFRRDPADVPGEITLVQSSSLSDDGASLWSGTRIAELAELLFDVQDHFAVSVYPEIAPLMLDLEVDVTMDGRTVIKQARPYVY